MATNSVSTSSIATCDLCSQLFSDPRLLPCLHSFCYKCLNKHFGENKSESYSCPTCDDSLVIPNGGIKGLPKDLRGSYEADIANYESKVKSQSDINCDRCITTSESIAIKFCCNCCTFLCKSCTEDHLRRRKTHEHELVDLGDCKKDGNKRGLLDTVPHKMMSCQLHSDEVLKFYCETCSLLICRDCIILSHSGHSYDRIENMAEKDKTDLMSVLGEANSAASKLEDAMAKGEKVIQNILIKKKIVDNEIKEKFKIIRDTLKSREEALLAKSSEIGLGKITALKLQNEEMRKIYDQTTRICGKVNEAAQVYTPAEMLSAKGAMTNKLKNLVEVFNEQSLDPCKSVSMPTSFDSSLLENEIGKFGDVTGGCCPEQSTAALYMSSAIKDKVITTVITARDFEGKPYPQGGETVKAKMKLIGNDDFSVNGDVKDNEDGSYEVSITPQTIGEHQLDITIENQHIKASPLIISVREERAYTSLQCQGNFTASSTPWDVAISDNEDVFVALYNSSSIKVLSKTGVHLRNIGTNGNPCAIAILGEIMYVTDHSNSNIQKFTTSGTSLSKFGSRGSGDGQLNYPRGICIDPDGNVYISEYGNNRISVFEADGTFNRHITGDLNGPWGIAFDPSGSLHVANYNLHIIKVFTSGGNYIREYGKGIIQYPAGIAIDPEGFAFISEYGASNRLFILNPQGVHIKTIQGFSHPAGIGLDKDGYIYVCTSSNHQVCKY